MPDTFTYIEHLRVANRAKVVVQLEELLLQQIANASAFGAVGQKVLGAQSAETIERLARGLAELTR